MKHSAVHRGQVMSHMFARRVRGLARIQFLSPAPTIFTSVHTAGFDRVLPPLPSTKQSLGTWDIHTHVRKIPASGVCPDAYEHSSFSKLHSGYLLDPWGEIRLLQTDLLCIFSYPRIRETLSFDGVESVWKKLIWLAKQPFLQHTWLFHGSLPHSFFQQARFLRPHWARRNEVLGHTQKKLESKSLFLMKTVA